MAIREKKEEKKEKKKKELYNSRRFNSYHSNVNYSFLSFDIVQVVNLIITIHCTLVFHSKKKYIYIHKHVSYSTTSTNAIHIFHNYPTWQTKTDYLLLSHTCIQFYRLLLCS